ncbi:MAG: NAD(P)/FAD-dependent oxidoreductase [Halomonas sp.]|uniref:NAD(P)/FAD-dependent oxidoreductase n=1 Tax=Halomonas sp. TaxID=1486246 RepID=UPI003F8F1DD1
MRSTLPLALIGAGHAHLHLLANRHRLPVGKVVVVEPGGFWYSGMASGVLGGQYQSADDRLEPARLVRQARKGGDVQLIRARLTGLDTHSREILLDKGQRLAVSAVSLNVGSRTLPDAFSTNEDNGITGTLTEVPIPPLWTVKPITSLVKLRQQLTTTFAQGHAARLVVIGAGASGIEIACNLRALAERHGAPASVSLVSRSTEPLPDAPSGASRWLIRHLRKRGIEWLDSRSFQRRVAGGVLLSTVADDASKPEYVEADHVIMASGLAPPKVIAELGLPVIEGRGLAIKDTLQSTAAEWVFAAGDCAAMINHPLPRLGVYGVRQAPILLDNLAAWYAHQPLSHYQPQPQALTILNLGNGMGLAVRGRSWFAGRLAMKAKQWLDRRFLDPFR